jgi:hypothetical protein
MSTRRDMESVSQRAERGDVRAAVGGSMAGHDVHRFDQRTRQVGERRIRMTRRNVETSGRRCPIRQW